MALRVLGSPRAAPGNQALDVRSSDADHKLTRQPGERAQNLIGILLFGGLAGDDHRTGLDIARVDPRGRVLAADNFI